MYMFLTISNLLFPVSWLLMGYFQKLSENFSKIIMTDNQRINEISGIVFNTMC